MPTTILHEEKAPHSISMKVILGLTLLLLFVATILSLVNTGDKTEFKIVAFTSIIIAFIFRSYFNMRFTVSNDRVGATMAPFSYSVKHDEIEDVYLDNVPWWMGWGLRIGWRRIAFVSQHGPAVVVRKKGGVFRTFWLTAKDPEDFAAKVRMRT